MCRPSSEYSNSTWPTLDPVSDDDTIEYPVSLMENEVKLSLASDLDHQNRKGITT
jgi:hypothetical protein